MRDGTDAGVNTMRRVVAGIIGFVTWVFLNPLSSSATDLSSFEFMLGDAWNFQTRLSVAQREYPSIDLRAKYETRPFEKPLYWAFRFGFNRRESGAWELQFIHHKIHLSNTTEEIQHFEITHGLNVVTFNRAFEALPITVRVGGGFVIAHPESVVRGLSWYDEGGLFDSGYHLTGPAVTAGVGKDFQLTPHLFVVLEAQLVAAWAKVPIAQGDATAPNVALHGMAGFGYRF